MEDMVGVEQSKADLVALIHACLSGTSNTLVLNFGCSLESHGTSAKC